MLTSISDCSSSSLATFSTIAIVCSFFEIHHTLATLHPVLLSLSRRGRCSYANNDCNNSGLLPVAGDAPGVLRTGFVNSVLLTSTSPSLLISYT